MTALLLPGLVGGTDRGPPAAPRLSPATARRLALGVICATGAGSVVGRSPVSVRPVRLLLAPALLVLVLLGAACGGSGDASGRPGQIVTVTKTVFTTPGKSVPVPADGPLTTEGYRAITAGLRKLLGRDPLLLQVGLYDEYAYFRVYDKTTGYADDYNWRNGVFAPPEPYKIGSTDMARSLFALEEIAADGPSTFVRNVSAIELDGAGDDTPYVSISRTTRAARTSSARS